MMKEQRRYPRLRPRALSSRVRVGGSLHIGLAVDNVSYGGVFIRTSTIPQLKSPVTIEMAVPGVRSPLVLPGTVAFVTTPAQSAARKHPAGFAVEFSRPLPTHLHQGLERLLASVGAEETAPRGEPVTDDVPAFKPPVPVTGQPVESVPALRRRLAEQERELERLRAENERLEETIRVLRLR